MSCEVCLDPQMCSSDFARHTSSENFLEHKIPNFEYRYGAVVEHKCGLGQVGYRVTLVLEYLGWNDLGWERSPPVG